MIQCPKCSATLPDGFSACQFCGAGLGNAPPSPKSRTQSSPASLYLRVSPGAPAWVGPAYVGVALYWMISSAVGIMQVFATTKGSPGVMGTAVIIFCGVTFLIGLGLLLRIEAARGVVNVLCFVNILLGALGLLGGFLLTGIAGIWGAIAMLRSAMDIALALLMIYLIGETD